MNIHACLTVCIDQERVAHNISWLICEEFCVVRPNTSGNPVSSLAFLRAGSCKEQGQGYGRLFKQFTVFVIGISIAKSSGKNRLTPGEQEKEQIREHICL